MRPVNGYSEAAAVNFGGGERLPAGGYVLRILDVREETTSYGTDVIVLRFDIAEGEHAQFFQKQYSGMSDEYKKWKGTYRLNVPQQRGSSEDDQKKYKRALGFFKAQIEAFNRSNGINIDCSKEWDTALLKGRTVGAVFGNKEYDYEGRRGWFTNCDHLVSAEEIRQGRFRIPADKPLRQESSVPSDIPAGFEPVDDLADSGAVPF